MDCCQCRGIESLFDKKEAEHRLREYQRSGPARSTRLLLDALVGEGVRGASLLDIGGGIGAIQHELAKSGIARVTDVDASSAYLAAAQSEAARQGYRERGEYIHGNFVELAPALPPAEIVTLDRVLCCYHDMPGLVRGSVAKAERLYGLVYPRDGWWVRAGIAAINLSFKVQRNAFRVFAHPSAAVEEIIRAHGFARRQHRTAGFWQVVLYARSP
jgi:magnesium-protoporphyrin O-methyltransferase